MEFKNLHLIFTILNVAILVNCLQIPMSFFLNNKTTWTWQAFGIAVVLVGRGIIFPVGEFNEHWQFHMSILYQSDVWLDKAEFPIITAPSIFFTILGCFFVILAIFAIFTPMITRHKTKARSCLYIWVKAHFFPPSYQLQFLIYFLHLPVYRNKCYHTGHKFHLFLHNRRFISKGKTCPDLFHSFLQTFLFLSNYSKAQSAMMNSLKNNYVIGDFSGKTFTNIAWDSLQLAFQCCGFHDGSDYKFLINSSKNSTTVVPQSCCNHLTFTGIHNVSSALSTCTHTSQNEFSNYNMVKTTSLISSCNQEIETCLYFKKGLSV